VFANVFEHAGLKAGETLMVHGATSGIGTTAIQMAKAAGARVIGTARGAAKARAARELGCDLAIDSTAEDFAAVVKAAGGCDVVLDMVGGDYFAKNLDVLKTGGRIVHVAAQAGGEVTLNINKLMMKRAVVTGSTLRPRDADEKARITRAVEEKVWPWVRSGLVRPPVDRTFPLAEAGKAHALMESGDFVGKLILVA
jgi:NADPH:quinone reductase-like Zn-dependent oxidoreductase